MRNLYKVLLVLVLIVAGVGYYAKTRNLDLKFLFSVNCDCHGGSCNVKKVSMSPADVMPEIADNHAHANHAAMPVHSAPAHPASTQPAPARRAFSTPAPVAK